MTRVNVVAAILLLACALGTVAARHRAREIYVALQHERARAHELDVEFGRLQLEQSTWSMHSRIEKIAASRLALGVPDSRRVQVVSRIPPAGAAQ